MAGRALVGLERLRRARRLGLTVEALVANPATPYHDLFAPEAVRTARERLQAAGRRQPQRLQPQLRVEENEKVVRLPTRRLLREGSRHAGVRGMRELGVDPVRVVIEYNEV